MHVAQPFRPHDPREAAAAVIAAHPFAVLVAQDAAGPVASHTPMLLEEGGDAACLIGHLARVNPQLRLLDGKPVLCVFAGPHTHISPTWYATAPAVPTWDYVAAHVSGVAELVEGGPELEAMLARLADAFEEGAWRLADQPERFRRGMLAGLVGVRVRVTTMAASHKLSQNRSPADRAGIVAGLTRRGRGDDLAVAALVAAQSAEGAAA